MENTNITINIANGDVFRKAIKAAASCALKPGHGSIYWQAMVYIGLYTDDNKTYMQIYANTLEHAVKYSFPVEVVNGHWNTDLFSIYVSKDDIKKVLNVPGDNITIKAEEGFNSEHIDLTFTNGKKKIALTSRKLVNYNSEVSILGIEKTFTYYDAIDFTYFAEIVKKFTPFMAKTDINPALKGMNVNGEYLEAIDGYKCIRAKIFKPFPDEVESFIICDQIVNIKNIFKPFVLSDNTLNIYSSKMYTRFIAASGNMIIEYTLRNLEGAFHPMASIFANSYKELFTVNAGELYGIAKEAESYCNDKNRMPLEIYMKDNIGIARIKFGDFTFSQSFECSASTNSIEMYMGFKPEYTMNGMEVFGNTEINVKYNGNLNPLILCGTGDFENIEAVILPVRMEKAHHCVEDIIKAV